MREYWPLILLGLSILADPIATRLDSRIPEDTKHFPAWIKALAWLAIIGPFIAEFGLIWHSALEGIVGALVIAIWYLYMVRSSNSSSRRA